MSILNLLISKYPRKTDLRAIHTLYTSMTIYSLMLSMNCKSYLELGSGCGGVMLMAGFAMKDAGNSDYELIGVDLKKERIEESKEILSRNGLHFDISFNNAETMEWNKDVDVVFVDCGNQTSQKLVDKYSKFAKKLVFVHDIYRKQIIKFPDNFIVVNVPEQKFLIAFNSDYTEQRNK